MTRWILWNLRCRRGRRCADVVLTRAHSTLPGVVMATEYTCSGCGTRYRREAMLGNDGNMTQREREVVG